MKKLFLDLKRNPKDCLEYITFNRDEYSKDDWDIVRSFKEFKEYIDKCTPTTLPYIISLDYALSSLNEIPELLKDDFVISNEYYKTHKKQIINKTGGDCRDYLFEYLYQNNISDDSYIPNILVHSKEIINIVNLHSLTYEVFVEKETLKNKLKISDGKLKNLTQETDRGYFSSSSTFQSIDEYGVHNRAKLEEIKKLRYIEEIKNTKKYLFLKKIIDNIKFKYEKTIRKIKKFVGY